MARLILSARHFEKNRRCMGMDPANMRMGGGVRKEGEDALLDPRVGWHGR